MQYDAGAIDSARNEIVYANINEKNLNTAAFGENSPKRTGNPGVFRIFAKLNQLLTALK